MTLALDNNLKFAISFQITDMNIAVGDTLQIYSSDDGTTWQAVDATCTVDSQLLCNF